MFNPGDQVIFRPNVDKELWSKEFLNWYDNLPEPRYFIVTTPGSVLTSLMLPADYPDIFGTRVIRLKTQELVHLSSIQPPKPKIDYLAINKEIAGG